ncbi:MAG: DUF932 domain-containing protein [Acaryochloris sp. RU_4_1]|nr:DUF932 domain-containing protein [Acaryochloris sp. RU_4_1]NJR56534.1 DUF932 domain-containing protein [Acaryochloris sp. CRU_2_0]
MKTGLSSFAALGAEIDSQISQKQDYTVQSAAVEMNESGDGLTVMTDSDVLELEISDTAHRQLAQAADIHGNYYSKLRKEDRELLAINVNRRLQRQGSRTHVLRTMGNTARAFLGGGYEIIDHDQVLEALYPEIMKLGRDLELLSTDVTEQRLYIKLAFPKVEGEIRKGDIIRSGVTITNSETGEGGLNVYPSTFRLVCTNGMTRMEEGERRTIRHSGSRMRELGQILERERAAVKLHQFVEYFSEAHDEAIFQRTLNQMRHSTEMRIEVTTDELMERARRHFGMTQAEQVQALNHLLIDEDLTAYGLMNAITRTAHDSDSYDRATELESMGSQVLSLPQSTWREIAIAR